MRACAIRNASEHSLLVSCLPGYDGGLQQSFEMRMQEITADQLASRADLLRHHHQQTQQPFLTLELDERSSGSSLSASTFGDTYTYGSRTRNKYPPNRYGRKEDEDASDSNLLDNALDPPAPIVHIFDGVSRNFTSEKAHFSVAGLKPATAYLCTVVARNARGNSRAVILVAQTLAAPESMNRKASGESNA